MNYFKPKLLQLVGLFLALQTLDINNASTDFAKGNLIIVWVPFNLHCSRHAIKTAVYETRFHCITPIRVL